MNTRVEPAGRRSMYPTSRILYTVPIDAYYAPLQIVSQLSCYATLPQSSIDVKHDSKRSQVCGIGTARSNRTSVFEKLR